MRSINHNRFASLMAGVFLAGAAMPVAATSITQVLLDEDFQDVTGISSAATVRTVSDINTNNPSQLAGSPVTSFSNTGNGNASDLSFNVRRYDNAIDGSSGSATFGNGTFDNFFGGSPNQFLVIGDDADGLGASPNGGTSTGASSTMSIKFALGTIVLTGPKFLQVGFDFVFDANNSANTDDFIAELILADNSTFNLLNFTAPSVSTRGAFSAMIPYASLAAAPTHLNFRLIEGEDNGSSAVGVDNIRVAAIPEPATLALLGLGLLALAGMPRRAWVRR